VPMSVDTPEDLERVRAYFARKGSGAKPAKG
jgi:CMP-2-keto-3-deoxyoctulosonic acid synthetase